MNALENFELALVAQLHERSQWLLGQRGDASPAQSIRCLGALSVRVENEPLALTGRARDVVSALLTRPSAQAPAAVIAGELWPHGELDYALGALNTTLYRMRRRKGLSDLIVLRDGYLSMGPKWFVDRKVLESALDTAAILLLSNKSCHAPTLSALADFVCAIYRGPLLEDEALDNVATARSRLQARLIDIVQRIEARLAAQNIGFGWTQSVCAIDPQVRVYANQAQPACASRAKQTMTTTSWVSPAQVSRQQGRLPSARVVV